MAAGGSLKIDRLCSVLRQLPEEAFDVQKRTKAAPAHDESYDDWLVRQVNEALAEANNPATVWISHDDAEREWEEERKGLLKSVKSK